MEEYLALSAPLRGAPGRIRRNLTQLIATAMIIVRTGATANMAAEQGRKQHDKQ